MGEVFIVTTLVVLFLALATGGMAGTLASLKGHDKSAWFMAGFFFSVIGLLGAVGLPDWSDRKKAQKPETSNLVACPNCHTTVVKGTKRCPSCLKDIPS